MFLFKAFLFSGLIYNKYNHESENTFSKHIHFYILCTYVFLQQPLRQTLTRQWLMNWKRVYNKKFRNIKKEVHTKYSTKLKFDYIQCETYFQSEWARIGGLQVQSVQFNSHNGLKSFWSRICQKLGFRIMNLSHLWLQINIYMQFISIIDLRIHIWKKLAQPFLRSFMPNKETPYKLFWTSPNCNLNMVQEVDFSSDVFGPVQKRLNRSKTI